MRHSTIARLDVVRYVRVGAHLTPDRHGVPALGEGEVVTKTACLEIHQINVGQGDSTLIINRDLAKVEQALTDASITVPDDPINWVPLAVFKKVSLVGTVKKALLIDAGDDEYGGDVLTYMTTQGVLDGKSKSKYYPDLMVMVSHYHDDHMAGLRSIFKEKIEPTKKKEKVKYVERFRPGIVYQSLRNKKMDPKTGRFTAFQDDLKTATTAPSHKTKLVEILPGGLDADTKLPTVISLGTGSNKIPIEITVIASGQSVANLASKKLVPIPGLSKKADQNDRSIAAMLQYGSFRYFFGGDLAGNGVAAGGNYGKNAMDPSTKKATSRHADVESTLGPALEAAFPATSVYKKDTPKFTTNGYATVMKANHHGSNSSDDVHLFATLRPAVFLLSSGIKSRFHRHPTQEVLNRADPTTTPKWGCHGTDDTPADSVLIENTIKQIYITEIAGKVKGKAFGVNKYKARIMGDVIIRPIDETVNAVQQATTKGATLTVQVYGMGQLTELFDPKSEFRPTETVTDGPYPIGPWEHSDKH